MRMKIVAVRPLVSRGMQGLVIESVSYGSNDNRWRLGVMEEWMICCSNHRGFVIHVHASRKQQEKQQSTLKCSYNTPSHSGPWMQFS